MPSHDQSVAGSPPRGDTRRRAGDLDADDVVERILSFAAVDLKKDDLNGVPSLFQKFEEACYRISLQPDMDLSRVAADCAQRCLQNLDELNRCDSRSSYIPRTSVCRNLLNRNGHWKSMTNIDDIANKAQWRWPTDSGTLARCPPWCLLFLLLAPVLLPLVRIHSVPQIGPQDEVQALAKYLVENQRGVEPSKILERLHPGLFKVSLEACIEDRGVAVDSIDETLTSELPKLPLKLRNRLALDIRTESKRAMTKRYYIHAPEGVGDSFLASYYVRSKCVASSCQFALMTATVSYRQEKVVANFEAAEQEILEERCSASYRGETCKHVVAATQKVALQVWHRHVLPAGVVQRQVERALPVAAARNFLEEVDALAML